MRLIAFLATLIAAGAAGMAGVHLWNVILAKPALTQETAPITSPETPETATHQGQRSKVWPAVFGKAAMKEPQPPKPPKPTAEPRPPLDSLGYRLDGTIRKDDDHWAIVSHASGQLILRVGDTLRDGMTVSKIDSQGLWIDIDGDTELIAFKDRKQN